MPFLLRMGDQQIFQAAAGSGRGSADSYPRTTLLVFLPASATAGLVGCGCILPCNGTLFVQQNGQFGDGFDRILAAVDTNISVQLGLSYQRFDFLFTRLTGNNQSQRVFLAADFVLGLGLVIVLDVTLACILATFEEKFRHV